MKRTAIMGLVLLAGVSAIPALAQSDTIGLRVQKLEKEMRAVQRRVFPAGVPVEPEIGDTQGSGAGNPASAPIADLTARVDALESQLKSLTGQVEQDGFRLKRLEEALRATEARIKALEAPATTSTTPATSTTSAIAAPAQRPATASPPAAAARPASPPAASATRTAAAPLARPTAPAARPVTPARVDPKRKAQVEAVEIPVTGDAVEDAYTYGFRLWTAKLYPEAQVKLREFVAKYPTHRRASYAQNLLGRAYLDEGKPALASVAFYENYQKMPRGERAPESLYWLGVALTRLNKLPDACRVFKEFDDVYGARAPADLKARVTKGRADARCAA